jgi:hypothetical protein
MTTQTKPERIIIVLLLLTTLAYGQSAPGPVAPSGVTTQPAPSKGLANDWLRAQSPVFDPWDLGGQIRLRFEDKESFAVPGLRPTAVDFRKDGGAGNAYLLLRQKIHLGYTPTDWLSMFAEARDSSSYWDRRYPHPESDRLDLHQGFALLGNSKTFPLTAKIGRQELSYGDERLIGAFDWNNIGRVFDAAKLRLEQSDYWIDGFVGRVIIPDNEHFNVPNDYDIFSGVYASTRTLIPKQETQLYFLARNVAPESPRAIGSNLPPFMMGATARDIYTLGARIKSLPGQWGGWDYEAELAGQLGNFYGGPNRPRLDHEAFAGHVAGGYTWAKTWGSPRLGLEYNYATGDDDPTDGTHGTFENLFPTNHKFYGFMDFFSWQNMHNPRLSTSFKPHKKVTLTGDLHAFWLADTDDYFYQANGAPRTTGGYGIRPEAGSYVGSEVDVIATYAPTPFLAVQGGYGHFFAGDYVKDTLRPVGGARDADWVYLQVVFTF